MGWCVIKTIFKQSFIFENKSNVVKGAIGTHFIAMSIKMKRAMLNCEYCLHVFCHTSCVPLHLPRFWCNDHDAKTSLIQTNVFLFSIQFLKNALRRKKILFNLISNPENINFEKRNHPWMMRDAHVCEHVQSKSLQMLLHTKSNYRKYTDAHTKHP